MKIKIERSGGFAGIPSSCEMDTDKLPSSLQGTVRELLEDRKSPVRIGSAQSKGSADYMNYKITIQNEMKSHVLECSEFEMDSDVKSMISYIQKNSVRK